MKSKPVRKRLDVLLVERGIADSQKSAQAAILAGEVKVEGQPISKAGALVAGDSRIELAVRQKYASRGGLKLEGALEDFSISAAGRICLDIGVSTGGFTDCLLQHGAGRVFAVDVNSAQLDWKLRQDARVVQVERNARELTPSDLAARADLVVVDLSFISVTKILAATVACANPGADFLILVKPQFELPKGHVGPGGIVQDADLHAQAIKFVQQCAEKLGLRALEVKPSRVKGAEGNQEYFLHARKAL